MHQRDTAADRIRPFLEAMERSIDAAKRERTRDDMPPSAQEERRPQTDNDHHIDTTQAFDPTRMKARPKRRFTT